MTPDIRKQIEALIKKAKIEGKGTCRPPEMDSLADIKSRADRMLGAYHECTRDIYLLCMEIERLRG